MSSQPSNPLLDYMLAQALVEQRDPGRDKGKDGNGDGFFRRALETVRPTGGAIDQFLTNVGQGVGTAFTGAGELAGRAIPGRDPIEWATERIRRTLQAERERVGEPETTTQKIAAGAGRFTGEALPALIPAAGAARVLAAAPRAARIAGTTAAAFAPDVAIGAGLRPEESAAGAIGELTGSETAKQISENVGLRALTEGLTGLGASGALVGAGKLATRAAPRAPRAARAAVRRLTSPSAATRAAPTVKTPTAKIPAVIDDVAKAAGRSAAAAAGGAVRARGAALGPAAREAQQKAASSAAAVATEAVREAYRNAGEGETGLRAAKELAEAFTGDAARSAWDRLMTNYRGVLLADPFSRARDVADNFFMGVTEAVKDVPASLADMVIQGFEKGLGRSLGGRVEAFGGVLPRGVRAQISGGARGAREIPGSFRAGLRGELPTRGRYIEGLGNDPRRATRVAALGFQMASMPDKIGRPVAQGRIAYNMARAQAIREGKKGGERASRIGELIANPTNEMIGDMEAQADLVTFMAENEATRKWLDIVSNGKGRYLQAIQPFARSATNVAERVFDYSPASWARVAKRTADLIGTARRAPGVTESERELLRAARRRVTQQTGRAVLGTAGPLIAGWALADRINPWYEKGKEAGRRKQAGQPSAAVRLGNTWVPLDRNFGPAGPIMVMGAQLRELARAEAGTNEDEELNVQQHENAFTNAINTYGRDLMDVANASLSKQGALALAQAMYEVAPGESLKQILDIAEVGPERAGAFDRAIRRQTPVPPLLARAARGIDPYYRQTETIGEEVLSRVPGVSRTVDPQIDVLGEPRKRPTSGIHAISPFATSTDLLERDPLRGELETVGYVVPLVQKWTGESDEDHQKRAAFYGEETRSTISNVIRSNEYLNAESDDERLKLLRGAVGRRRSELTRELRDLMGAE